jgi:ubiquinone/menaquinone biosynthesis C-methylase UbiE
MNLPASSVDPGLFVPETRIGFWFLGSQTWETHVIRVALRDLERLIGGGKPVNPVVLDAGCGQGKSLRPLYEHFAPARLIGVVAEPQCVGLAAREAEREGVSVDLRTGDLAALDLPDGSVDVVFCHQTFHHLTRQHEALAEFYRVLKPGGLLLFAESTRAYIESWIIRLLFRHPMHVQRTAGEYMDMLRAQGFRFGAQNISFPYLWWSRSDLGALEFFGFRVPPPGEREETLINLVATKR